MANVSYVFAIRNSFDIRTVCVYLCVCFFVLYSSSFKHAYKRILIFCTCQTQFCLFGWEIEFKFYVIDCLIYIANNFTASSSWEILWNNYFLNKWFLKRFLNFMFCIFNCIERAYFIYYNKKTKLIKKTAKRKWLTQWLIYRWMWERCLSVGADAF